MIIRQPHDGYDRLARYRCIGVTMSDGDDDDAGNRTVGRLLRSPSPLKLLSSSNLSDADDVGGLRRSCR